MPYLSFLYLSHVDRKAALPVQNGTTSKLTFFYLQTLLDTTWAKQLVFIIVLLKKLLTSTADSAQYLVNGLCQLAGNFSGYQ